MEEARTQPSEKLQELRKLIREDVLFIVEETLKSNMGPILDAYTKNLAGTLEKQIEVTSRHRSGPTSYGKTIDFTIKHDALTHTQIHHVDTVDPILLDIYLHGIIDKINILDQKIRLLESQQTQHKTSDESKHKTTA